MKPSLLIALCIACGAAACAPTVAPGPKYAPLTTLPLAGERCQGTRCTCRPLDSVLGQKESPIKAGFKRFELRFPRSTSAIWVEIKGRGTYYKNPDKVLPSCFYIDLPSGKTRFVIHSENRDPEVGLQTGLVINEHGTKEGIHWYRSFEFTCGGMNRCTKKGLRSWVTFMRNLPKHLFNPCGSVRIREISASGTRAVRKDLEYQDLTARFTLDIYKFDPYKDPASAECQGRRKAP